MKHNAIFIILTAIILVIGFYAMNITEYFIKSTPDEDFRSVSRIESNAVYLSSNRNIIDPMSNIKPCSDEIPLQTRYTATAIIKAMARHDNITYIAWGVDIRDLDDAWQASENGYIYVEKWKYINYLKKEERLLDCIIDTSDYRIVYIRFYCDTKYQVSANDMNSSLESFDAESAEFYSNLVKFTDSIENYISYRDDMQVEETETLYPPEIYFGNYPHYDFDLIDPVTYYVNAYQAFKDIVYIATGFSTVSRLASFWISPMGIHDFIESPVIYSLTEQVYPTNYVMEEFLNLSTWIQPSYSSRDGRIYQTINTNNIKLTVIYCVKEDIIEGYYFE